ncbi:MAG: hypothetical protein WA096_10535, partial [Smithella sp.]
LPYNESAGSSAGANSRSLVESSAGIRAWTSPMPADSTSTWVIRFRVFALRESSSCFTCLR